MADTIEIAKDAHVGSPVQHTLTEADVQQINDHRAHHGLLHYAEVAVGDIVAAIKVGVNYVRLLLEGGDSHTVQISPADPAPHPVKKE